MFDLRVWPNIEADGNTVTTTPGKGKDSGKNNQMQRFGKLYKQYCNGQIPKVSLSFFFFVIQENDESENRHHIRILQFVN